jgi:hypothetical protein
MRRIDKRAAEILVGECDTHGVTLLRSEDGTITRALSWKGGPPEVGAVLLSQAQAQHLDHLVGRPTFGSHPS